MEWGTHWAMQVSVFLTFLSLEPTLKFCHIKKHLSACPSPSKFTNPSVLLNKNVLFFLFPFSRFGRWKYVSWECWSILGIEGFCEARRERTDIYKGWKNPTTNQPTNHKNYPTNKHKHKQTTNAWNISDCLGCALKSRKVSVFSCLPGPG